MRSNSRADRFFRAALIAVCFALLSVVFGAYMRQSEAGLGCPNGPACEAKPIAPAMVMNMVAPEPASMRAWKETFAKYLGWLLSLWLVRLAGLGWQFRHKPEQQVIIPLVTLVLVMTFTVVSVVTVDLHSKPLVMMTQYLGGLIVLALLWWIVLREQRLFRSAPNSPLTRQLRPRAVAALLIGFFAITLGAWSTVNYAGLACPDFPTCQGQYWPPVDFAEGFMRWYGEGLSYDRSELNLAGATAIQFAHRVGALIALLYIGWLGLRILRVGMQENLSRYGLLLLLMLSFAIAFGIMNAVGGMPIVISVTHSATGALLLLTLVTVYHVVRAPRPIVRK